MNYHPDFIWAALKMLLSLGILLAVLITALYFAKRIFKGEGNHSKGKMIRVLASTYVGVKKNISLVEVPGSVLVLGITNDAINLLTKIEDEEILRRFSETEEEKISASFSHQLGKLLTSYKRDR